MCNLVYFVSVFGSAAPDSSATFLATLTQTSWQPARTLYAGTSNATASPQMGLQIQNKPHDITPEHLVLLQNA